MVTVILLDRVSLVSGKMDIFFTPALIAQSFALGLHYLTNCSIHASHHTIGELHTLQPALLSIIITIIVIYTVHKERDVSGPWVYASKALDSWNEQTVQRFIKVRGQLTIANVHGMIENKDVVHSKATRQGSPTDAGFLHPSSLSII